MAIVNNTNDSGAGSLREALSAAGLGGRVDFQGIDDQTITADSPLPALAG